MTIHRGSDSEAFWYGLNPFKSRVHTSCGKELDNPTEVPEDRINCRDCLDSDPKMFLGLF